MTTPALDIIHLNKTYNGHHAVDDISFSIEPGEIFGLLGPNGAGKSTTINMISGVTRIDKGTITVFGYDNQKAYRTTRRMIGVMHQEVVIDNFFTIDQTLRFHAGYYGIPDDPQWRTTLIDRLGLRPHLHKVMIKLSGGLKRRFMIAKALIHKPNLLILDEPTAGVDVELRHTLWEFIREINHQGTTILLTTHYLEEAEQMCKRIAIMNHGKLITLEETHRLLQQFGARRVMVRLNRPYPELPNGLDAFSVEPLDPFSLRLTLPSQMTVSELLIVLQRLDLPIVDLETERAGLEDIFLQITQSKEPT
ncbi:MAG: ABC transporter ATP-binding protein [Deltaproteobacteria bacterium]|jgi:ABC-2 type transport system ATP-binding protein|nr:ABC transporter ATP-binding protein [Deltaproteobacteria bacterium]